MKCQRLKDFRLPDCGHWRKAAVDWLTGVRLMEGGPRLLAVICECGASQITETDWLSDALGSYGFAAFQKLVGRLFSDGLMMISMAVGVKLWLFG